MSPVYLRNRYTSVHDVDLSIQLGKKIFKLEERRAPPLVVLNYS